MKKFLFFVILALNAGISSAQIKYEPGYIISNDGLRMSCEIRNLDWKGNPTSFEYRSSGTTEVKVPRIADVAEFGIDDGVTYQRHTVDMDRSTDMVERMDDKRNPVFKSETLFLRLLVSGKAVLLQYEEGNLQRFFYSIDKSPVQQLVYKRYMVGVSNDNVGINELYKQQILNEMKCASISKKDIERLDYKRSDLTKIFSKYNQCDGSAASGENAEEESVINMTLRPGLTYNSLKISDNTGTTTDFGRNASFRVGFEIENVLPFNKGLWALTLEPAYQKYSATQGNITVNYQSFDIGVGVRRYLFKNGNNKLYANLGFVYGIPLAADQAIQFPLFSLKVSSGINVAAGVGYIMNRFSAELNYAFGRGIMGEYVNYSSSYKGPALLVGYRISK